jgi:pyridoxamine 5'-phosphate oxidase
MTLKDNRREYDYGKLSRDSLSDCPFEQFDAWMQQALDANIVDPTAMCLATVDDSGRPWQRVVLLKGFDESGFVFYTNLSSRKALNINSNSQASIQFSWLQLDRQVIVGGRAERLADAEVVEYFNSRPLSSQLAAWASDQSSPIASRDILESNFKAIQKKFSSSQVPVPDFWGGYRIIPEEFEFWQGGEKRLHDRFCFLLRGDNWEISRLSP